MRQIKPGEWVEDPYNVFENVTAYPEPTNFGLLPAYGLYVRHVDGLTVNNFKTSYEILDDRVEQRTEYPRTVNRPWLKGAKNQTVKAGEIVTLELEAVNPADYTKGGPYAVTITCKAKPEGSTFADNIFTWNVAEGTVPGPYNVTSVTGMSKSNLLAKLEELENVGKFAVGEFTMKTRNNCNYELLRVQPRVSLII